VQAGLVGPRGHARQDACPAAFVHQCRSGGRVRVHEECREFPVQPARGLDPGQHFLTDVAALVVADGGAVEAGLGRQHAGRQLGTPRGDSSLDPPGLAFRRGDDLKLRQWHSGRPPQVEAGCPDPRGASDEAASGLGRVGVAGHVKELPTGGQVGHFDVVGDEVTGEAGFQFLLLSGRCFDPERFVRPPEHMHECLQPALRIGHAGGQGGLRRIAHVLGELAVEVAHGIRSAEGEHGAGPGGEAAEFHALR
jgi:hypothetical protein